jgi:hypothetical protein
MASYCCVTPRRVQGWFERIACNGSGGTGGASWRLYNRVHKVARHRNNINIVLISCDMTTFANFFITVCHINFDLSKCLITSMSGIHKYNHVSELKSIILNSFDTAIRPPVDRGGWRSERMKDEEVSGFRFQVSG